MNQKVTSKKPNALSKLREIIREEVKTAVREEIVPILLEVITAKNKPAVESTAPSYLQTIHSVNSTPPVKQRSNTSLNPVSSILEETRQQMFAGIGMPADDEYRTLISANTNDMHMFSSQPVNTVEENPASQINSMIATANRGSKEEYVEINQVPDFSAVMQKMNL